MNSIADIPFVHLTTSIRDQDDRQDAVLSLLEAQPATEADAVAIIRRLAHVRRNRSRAAPLQLSAEPDDDDNVGTGIHEAISLLPSADRELVTLRYIKGMTINEIAVHLGISYPRCHDRITRATKKLESILQISG